MASLSTRGERDGKFNHPEENEVRQCSARLRLYVHGGKYLLRAEDENINRIVLRK